MRLDFAFSPAEVGIDNHCRSILASIRKMENQDGSSPLQCPGLVQASQSTSGCNHTDRIQSLAGLPSLSSGEKRLSVWPALEADFLSEIADRRAMHCVAKWSFLAGTHSKLSLTAERLRSRERL